MATMMAALYYGRNDIRLEEVPRPVPGPGEALVHVRYCGICGSDLRSYQDGPEQGDLPLPRVLGHEFAGDVVELGPGVTGFQPGDRVTAAPATSCGQCVYCQHGFGTLCLNALDFGTTQSGAQAEYVLIPARLVAQGGLVLIRAGVSYSKAALMEPLGTCWHGLHVRGCLQRGESVLIIGDGTIGLIQVMLARYLGAGKIICAGHHDERLTLARRWGADITINAHDADMQHAVHEASGGMGTDLVVVSVPDALALQQALTLARGGGRIVAFSSVPHGKTMTVDPNWIHCREVAMMGAFNCTVEEFREALDVGSSLPLEELVTHRVPLARAVEGYQLLAERRALKVLIDAWNSEPGGAQRPTSAGK